MTDEEFASHLSSIKYFWEEKGDVERYCDWESIQPELMKRRPDIAIAYQDYKARRMIFSALVRSIEF